MYALQTIFLHFGVYWTFELSKYSKVHIHAFYFWLAEKYFEPPWKSGPAKTGPAGPVPPPLVLKYNFRHGFICGLIHKYLSARCCTPLLFDMKLEGVVVYTFNYNNLTS